MMPLNPILAAVVADMAVGMFWYSDYAFGPMWHKLIGKPRSNKNMLLHTALQAVISLVYVTAVYIAIMTFQKSQGPYAQEMFTQWFSWFFTEKAETTELMSALKTAGFIWLGLFIPSYLSCAIWQNPYNWNKFYIKAGHKLAQLLVLAAVFAKLG